MKNYLTKEMWDELELILAKHNVGYNVMFDDHLGIPEMIVTINNLSINRPEASSEE